MNYKNGDRLFIDKFRGNNGSYGTLEHSRDMNFKYFLRCDLNSMYVNSGFYLVRPARYAYKVVRRN